MTALVEIRSGAQVLPPVKDERATTPAWFAHLACDADLRKRAQAYADLASSLKVVRS